MSGVPKSKRSQSSVEYVWQAQLLFHQTFELALRLPKRWTFYLSERMVGHAEQALHHAKSANSIYVSCAVDAQLRRMHLQQAYCHAQTLSSLIDEVYKLAPVKPVGDTGALKPAITQARFSDLIHCLDKVLELLKGVMRSDMRRWKDYLKGEQVLPEAGLQMSFFDLEGLG
ncbi:MAG: hypothetical protein Q4A07_01410 [Coriobacteriales bacterium]|nr:hypothetical protein [Coriobacteriales bacterium]